MTKNGAEECLCFEYATEPLTVRLLLRTSVDLVPYLQCEGTSAVPAWPFGRMSACAAWASEPMLRPAIDDGGSLRPQIGQAVPDQCGIRPGGKTWIILMGEGRSF